MMAHRYVGLIWRRGRAGLAMIVVVVVRRVWVVAGWDWAGAAGADVVFGLAGLAVRGCVREVLQPAAADVVAVQKRLCWN